MGKAKNSGINKKQKRVNQAIVAGLMFSCSSAMWNPTASAENLTITTGSLTSDVSPHDLSGNTVIIGGGNPAPDFGGWGVYGGFNQLTTQAVSNNTVSILSGINIVQAYGGGAWGAAEIYNNTINVHGGSMQGLVGGDSYGGIVHDNKVNVDGGLVHLAIHGARSTTGDVYNNSVVVSGGIVDSGGYACGAFSNDGRVYNNQVTITRGSVPNVWGGRAYNGNADNNTVNITGGTIATSAYGGVSQNGNVSNNTVNITGGTIQGYIAGGCSNAGTEVKNNIVIINPQTNLDITQATLYGGFLNTYHSNNVIANNVLKVYGKNIEAKNIYNFSDIYFYLPANIQNTDTVLTLNDSVQTNISHSNVKAGIVGNANVAVGDKINLIHNEHGITSTGTTYGNLTEGVSVDYALNIAPDAAGKNIVATLAQANLKPQTKSLTETRAGAMAFLNSGITSLSDIGIKNAINAAVASNMFAPFTAMGNSSMRYNTGSHVDNNGNNFNLGFARTLDYKKYRLTIGSFLEAGWAKYDSYLDSGVHGSGNMNYYGFGLFTHQANKNGLYYEGSLHYGQIDSDYKSNDLLGSREESYKLSTPYYGLHIGLGKVITVNSKKSFDIYSKYYYSCQDSNTAKLSSGEIYDFKSTASNRIKTGVRYVHSYSETKKVYVGAAYEYELSGSATATYKGYNTLSPSLKGGSGMFEVGCKIKSTKTSPLMLDIALTGWTGRQQGISTNAGVSWNF